MVAILIVNGKLLIPGEIISIKMKWVLNQNFLLKKRQNYEYNNGNGCPENDYNIDFDVNKSSTDNGHKIKHSRRPSLVRN